MKSNATRLLAVAVVIAGWTGSAFANHYGMAGCGLGSLVFLDKPGKIQILAATTNNIISPQTSAITSGTSGCFEDEKSASIKYIETNEFALREDISRGKGETLSALFHFWGCDSADSLGAQLQHNYGTIFPEGKTGAESIRNAMESTLKPTGSCQAFVG